MPRYIAIDWDQTQLHVVAGLAGGGKVKFQRTLLFHEDQSPAAADAEALGKRLRDHLKAAGVAPAPVLACVARDRVIVKELRFPSVPPAEEAGVVRFQAVKELSDSPDDVTIDYVTVGAPKNGEQHALALVVRREIVAAYQKLCQAAGLKLAGLTPRPFGVGAGLTQASAAAPADEAEGSAAVVVIAERWAEFAVVRGGIPLLSRPLGVGPNLAGEVRRNLMVYGGQAGRPPVKAVYIAGGGPELRGRLEEMIDLPVREFDPFAGAVGLDVPAGSRGSFAGAAGLLYARAETRGLPINFVQPRQPRPPRDPKNRRVALVGAALAVAAAGVVFCCWLVYSNALHNLAAVQAQRDGLEGQLVEARKEGKLFKALDDWDNVVWIDELYDLTYRIPDVNALRVTQLTAEPATRTAKTKYTARVILKGTYTGNEGRKALDQLIDGFKQDGYYSPEAPKVVGSQFTLTVNLERRPPAEYHHALKSAPDNGRKGRAGDDGEDFLP